MKELLANYYLLGENNRLSIAVSLTIVLGLIISIIILTIIKKQKEK